MTTPRADPTPPIPTIRFVRSPAFVTLPEALGLAARYWAATWERWVLAVAAVALADGLATWLLGGTAMDRDLVTRSLLPGSAAIDPSALPRLMAGPLAVAVVSLVADWFLVANAVAGLRGREVTLAWVAGAGLRVLLAIFLLTLLATAVALPIAALGALGVFGLLLLLPALFYVAIRLQLWTTAVFDGLGLQAALRASWALTRGAVLRVVGWALAMFGLSLLVLVANVTITALVPGLPAIPAAIGSGLGTAFAAFSVIVTAILYESQRLRMPGAAPSPDQFPSRPVDPNAPPPPPPQGPWSG